MKIIKKAFSFIETTLSMVAMCAMTLLCFANVVSRYLLHASLSFTEEITVALFVYVCVMGTALCAKERGHLGMSILTDFLSESGQKLASAIGNLIATIFSFLMVYLSAVMVIKQYKVGMVSIALAIPEWIYEIWLPIGAFFYAVRFLGCAIEDYKGYKAIKQNKEVH